MALRIQLKPFEELFVSRSVIHNGPERASIAISGTSPLLRGTDYLPHDAVDTICKQLQFAVQTLYLEEPDYPHAMVGIQALADEVLTKFPAFALQVAKMLDQIQAGDIFKALKSCRALVAQERESSLA